MSIFNRNLVNVIGTSSRSRLETNENAQIKNRFCLLFILYLAYSTEYVFENEILKIKCGFLYCRSIKVSRIKSVSKTNNLIASPAASLDRIEIKYDEYGVLAISPKNKDAFVKNLLEVNPNIIDQITK